MKKLRVPWRQVDLGEPPVSDPKRLRLTSVRPQFPRPHIPSNNYRVIQETRGFGGEPEDFVNYDNTQGLILNPTNL